MSYEFQGRTRSKSEAESARPPRRSRPEVGAGPEPRQPSEANFLPINTADNVLHIGLAVAMIALGALGIRLSRRPPHDLAAAACQ